MSEDPDFLAKAQLSHDPDSWEELVREVFLIEHGCTKDGEIARVLGVHFTRVSQIVNHPEKLRADSIRQLIAPLRSKRNRRRILAAWIKREIGEDIDSPVSGPLTGKVATEKTLRRVDRQMREGRLAEAAVIAREAAKRTDEPALREQLLDRAYLAFQRLNFPGQTMAVARMIAEGASERREWPRLAAAHVLRARVLAQLLDAKPGDVEAVLAEAECLLEGPSRATPQPYVTAGREMVESYRRGIHLTFVERRVVAASETELRSLLADALSRVTRKERRPTNLLLAARIHLLLGETFAAQECVDKVSKVGKSGLSVREICGMVTMKIVQATEPPEEAARQLRIMSRNCLSRSELYYHSTMEADLARVESLMFPPSRPVL